MATLQCPGCGSNMDEKKEPDITLELCQKCEGVFLDKNELNELATGLSGDIEFCSIDEEDHKDKFPKRNCPKCKEQLMNKINLLRFSDIIFDFCPQCEGLFLDRGEIVRMNAELEKLSETKKGEEFRGYIDNHLVRLDKVVNVNMVSKTGGLFLQPDVYRYLRLSVYFTKPFKMGLKINSEKWADRFVRALTRRKDQDIEVGNKEFDAYFLIQGEDRQQVKNLLSNEDIQNCLLKFIKGKPKLAQNKVTFEISDYRISCVDGPCKKEATYDVTEDPNKFMNSILEMVKIIESR